MLRAAGAAALAGASAAPALAQDGKKIGVALVGGAHIHTPQYVGALKDRKSVTSSMSGTTIRSGRRNGRRSWDWASRDRCRAIWDDPEITAVVICSETNRHHDLVMARREREEAHVRREAAGITAQESFAMAEAIEKANLLFTTGYFMRTSRARISS